MIQEETRLVKEAFGSDSWSARDIADVGDALYRDMVPKRSQVDLSNTPDIRQIMAMAVKSRSNLLNTDVIIDIIDQVKAQGIILNRMDPEVWIATVQGKFSNYGGPRADQVRRDMPDLYNTFQGVSTSNLDRKFQNATIPRNRQRPQGNVSSIDHPADGMSPVQHNDVHQGGLEGPSVAGQTPGSHIKNTLQALSTKDLSDPKSAALAVKVLQSLISQLEKVSQLS